MSPVRRDSTSPKKSYTKNNLLILLRYRSKLKNKKLTEAAMLSVKHHLNGTKSRQSHHRHRRQRQHQPTTMNKQLPVRAFVTHRGIVYNVWVHYIRTLKIYRRQFIAPNRISNWMMEEATNRHQKQNHVWQNWPNWQTLLIHGRMI